MPPGHAIWISARRGQYVRSPWNSVSRRVARLVGRAPRPGRRARPRRRSSGVPSPLHRCRIAAVADGSRTVAPSAFERRAAPRSGRRRGGGRSRRCSPSRRGRRTPRRPVSRPPDDGRRGVEAPVAARRGSGPATRSRVGVVGADVDVAADRDRRRRRGRGGRTPRGTSSTSSRDLGGRRFGPDRGTRRRAGRRGRSPAAPRRRSTPRAARGGTGAMRACSIAVRRVGASPLRPRTAGARCRARLRSATRRCRSRHAERVELLGAAAERALHDERPGRDRRERADLLGDEHRMPQRQQEQRAGRAGRPTRRAGGRASGRSGSRAPARCGGRRRTGCRAPRPPRPRGPLDHPPRAVAHVRRRVAAAERGADLHARSLARVSRCTDSRQSGSNQPCRSASSIRPSTAAQSSVDPSAMSALRARPVRR